MKNGRYRDVDQTFWFRNDKLHREDGPAMEGDDGACVWYLEGKRHREDGPAMTWSGGEKEWWLNGQQLTEEEFSSYLAKKQLNTSLHSTLQTRSSKSVKTKV